MDHGDGRPSIGSILAGDTGAKVGFDVGVLFLIRALMLPASQMVGWRLRKGGRGCMKLGNL
jgi:hypothetical protein